MSSRAMSYNEQMLHLASTNRRGWFYALLAQVFWGMTSVIISLINKSLPGILLVAVRHGIGALFLGSNILAGNRHVFKNAPWVHLVLLGILAGGLPDLLLVTAVRHCGPIIAVLLARLEIPLGVLLAHILLKEKVSRKAYLASVIGLIGAGFISYKPGQAINLHSSFYVGIVIGIGAGLAWGLSSVYAKFILNKKADPLAVTFIRLSLGSLTSLLLTVLFVSQPLRILQHLGLHDWLLLIYLGLFASGVGYLLFYRSLDIIDAHIAQILIGVSMIVALVFGLAVGVAVTALQWLGIAIIIFSIYLIKTPPPAVESLD